MPGTRFRTGTQGGNVFHFLHPATAKTIYIRLRPGARKAEAARAKGVTGTRLKNWSDEACRRLRKSDAGWTDRPFTFSATGLVAGVSRSSIERRTGLFLFAVVGACAAEERRWHEDRSSPD